jgi:two-component system LytT family response regulator
MREYTAIILDDEEKGRHSLNKFINEYCPEIEILGIASSGEEAIELVLKHRPKILFLDIEIAQASSEYNTTFDLLPKLPSYNFEVVFVTAYEHYALQAIRSHAIGYILKPISITDLEVCVNSVIDRLQKIETSDRLTELVKQVQTKEQSKRIWIHSVKDVIPVHFEEIIRLEAQGKYTDIYCEDGKKITSSKNLGEFYDIFDHSIFIKIHRSHIVNASKIKKYTKFDGGALIMKDGKELPVSKSGKERLFQIL